MKSSGVHVKIPECTKTDQRRDDPMKVQYLPTGVGRSNAAIFGQIQARIWHIMASLSYILDMHWLYM